MGREREREAGAGSTKGERTSTHCEVLRSGGFLQSVSVCVCVERKCFFFFVGRPSCEASSTLVFLYELFIFDHLKVRVQNKILLLQMMERRRRKSQSTSSANQ